MKPLTKSDLFINRHSIWAVLFLVLQQLIVASSTYFIARLSTDIASGNSFTHSLIFFAASLLVVFIPGGIASVLINLSKWDSLAKYVQHFNHSYQGKTRLRSEEKLKKTLTSFLSTESYLVVDEGHKFLFDWLSTLLNVTFNIVALGMVLDQRLLIAYAISAVLVTAFLKFSSKIAYEMSNRLQHARLRLQHFLSSGWENILIGNKYSHDLWKEEYSKSIKSAQSDSANSEGWNFMGSSLGMLLAMLPVFVLTGFLFHENSGNHTILAVLVSTLPRQILILQHTHVVVYYATSWSALKAKLDGLVNSLIVDADPKFIERIAFEKIRIYQHDDHTNHTPVSLTEVLSLMNVKPIGRLTIRGSNGAGKSTLLNVIKEQLGESAFLLPAHHSLQFKDSSERGGSTGQKLARHLEEIKRELQTRFVLLDEWDANLDSIAQQNMNSLIDDLSKQTVVLEVRHRGVDA